MEQNGQKNPYPDQRLQLAKNWIESSGVALHSELTSIAGDASFRRYFRFRTINRTLILMDAPPPGEDVRPFIDVAGRLRRANLHAPEIILSDRKNGFMLLEDLGNVMYRDLLNTSSVHIHFPDLFNLLKVMAQNTDTANLPTYDSDTLRAEMNLLPNWYLALHRRNMSRDTFDLVWDQFCDQVIASAFDQPQSFVHRDFHSSNLLKTSDNTVGIIDFQDAVRGPVSYDFISLVWDRYITWPRRQIEGWMEDMRRMLGLGMTPEKWRRHCDLMGLQRNIKVVGIFARLYYRDKKQGYIEMIPRFYDYLLSTLRHYPEFSDLLEVLEHKECMP